MAKTKKTHRYTLPPLPDTVFLTGNAAKEDIRRRADRMQKELLAQNKYQAEYLPETEQEIEPVPETTESKNLTLFD